MTLVLTNADFAKPGGLTSVVFRLPREKLKALKALSQATRIRKSEYLREAIADLLAKYEEPENVQALRRIATQIHQGQDGLQAVSAEIGGES